jgi:hypothetical protein
MCGFDFGWESLAIDRRKSSICKDGGNEQYRLSADLLHDGFPGYPTIVVETARLPVDLCQREFACVFEEIADAKRAWRLQGLQGQH